MVARLVTVLSDSAAVSLALRLSDVEITSAVPTQINMISTASPPATNPMLTRLRVRLASHRLANTPNSSVATTTRITGPGISATALALDGEVLQVSAYAG